jgi:hypothetical protein
MIHRLLVPGLLEAPPGGADMQALPRFPVLEGFIARADEDQAEGHLEELLMRLFGLDADQGAAPFCYLAETGKIPETGILRACPVHLRADRDRVLLFPLDESRLDLEESRELAAQFNTHFAEDGLVAEVVRPHHWYVLTERLPQVKLAPLDQLAGRSLREFLPDSEKECFWLSVINETQMLFFDSPVNRSREQAGQPPVNGLWFDGGGYFPGAKPAGPALVSSDNRLLRGLEACADQKSDETVSVIDDICQALLEQDASAWLRARQQFEKTLEALMKKEEIVLYSCDGRSWHWKPSCSWRFWRFSLPLTWS